MDRSNHYEAAFESYLQSQRLRYLAVDERRRVFHDDEAVKSLDFVVLSESGVQLMVDVKGRRFPGGTKGRLRRVWESWSTKDDVEGLHRWTASFGDRALGVLVFMYHLQPCVTIAADTVDLWTWRDRRYLLRAVAVDDYCLKMKVRSPKWDTVHLAKEDFNELVRPFRYFTNVVRSERRREFDDEDQDWGLCDGVEFAAPQIATSDPTT